MLRLKRFVCGLAGRAETEFGALKQDYLRIPKRAWGNEHVVWDCSEGNLQALDQDSRKTPAKMSSVQNNNALQAYKSVQPAAEPSS